MSEKSNNSLETWNKVAAAYHDKFSQLKLYDSSYLNFCKALAADKVNLLEIGCGPGTITSYLVQHRPDFQICAIDGAPAMIELAKKTIPQVEFLLMDCRDLSKLTLKYDGVISGFCIPYLTQEECKQLFFDCSNLLTQGGILYISAIEGSYADSKIETSSDGKHRMMVYYYEEAWLEKALLEVNIEIFQSMRIPYLKSTGITESHLVLLAKKI